jgi:signal transduction histidine kinase
LDYGFLALTLVLFVMFFFLVDALYRVSNIESEKAQVDGMLASMHDALIAYDKDFKITLVNESLEILCNIKKEDVLGKKITPE